VENVCSKMFYEQHCENETEQYMQAEAYASLHVGPTELYPFIRLSELHIMFELIFCISATSACSAIFG